MISREAISSGGQPPNPIQSELTGIFARRFSASGTIPSPIAVQQGLGSSLCRHLVPGSGHEPGFEGRLSKALAIAWPW